MCWQCCARDMQLGTNLCDQHWWWWHMRAETSPSGHAGALERGLRSEPAYVDSSRGWCDGSFVGTEFVCQSVCSCWAGRCFWQNLIMACCLLYIHVACDSWMHMYLHVLHGVVVFWNLQGSLGLNHF